jgi:hypothetical protein
MLWSTAAGGGRRDKPCRLVQLGLYWPTTRSPPAVAIDTEPSRKLSQEKDAPLHCSQRGLREPIRHGRALVELQRHRFFGETTLPIASAVGG